METTKTYTHIVNLPEKSVSHSFTATGWNQTKCHAGSIKGGVTYKTVCDKEIVCHSAYGNEAQKPEQTNNLRCDPEGTGHITCAACRKALGLKPLKK
jgi:hypothetical protein